MDRINQLQLDANRLRLVKHPDSWYYEIPVGEYTHCIISIGEDPEIAARATRIEKLSVS